MKIDARLLVLLPLLLVESVWAADEQFLETGEYRAESQANIDTFAESYPECKQLISLKIALLIYVALFGYDPINPVVSLAAFQRIHGVGNAF